MREHLNPALFELRRSAIREFNRMARQTPGCVSLTLGEPDFDTPDPVKQGALEALANNETHYIENNGAAALREDIARFEREYNGLDYSPDEVIVTIGATEGLFTALFGIIAPGDEVIVPVPAFGLYESIITMCGGKFVPLDTAPNGFQITEAALEAAISPRTKAIVLNSPNNPTGCVLTPESIENVRRAFAGKPVFLICDEVYRQLVYTDEFVSPATMRGVRPQLIIIQSFSKPYAMTGWRVGYMLCDAQVKERLELVHQFTVVSAASIAQRACRAALRCDASQMRETYRRRRDYTVERLRGMGLPVCQPEGAFYAFPSISATGMSSDEFCRRLITEAGVAAVPGSCFDGEGHMRISYCVSDENLQLGLDRLEGFLGKL